MRDLITGGAGFIGSHLAEELIKRGHHVHLYDNLSPGPLANIEHLFRYDRFTNTIGDVLDREQLRDMLEEADHVIHLAAINRFTGHGEATVANCVDEYSGYGERARACAHS
jgi:UDP-glucose 4-epimerase